MYIFCEEPITRRHFNSDPSFWEENHTDCNCGAYALNLIGWYLPYNNRDERDNWIDTMLEEDYSEDEIKEIVLTADVSNMLNQFGDYLIPVNSPDEVPDNEDVIAYRVSLFVCRDDDPNTYDYADYDFHFKVRRDGKWSEKVGMDKVVPCELSPDVPWEVEYNLIYDSSIRYFKINKAVKI